MRIFLEFSPEQSGVHRRRLSYAFSVFCAVYGHKPVFDVQGDTADVWISYARTSSRDLDSRVVSLSDLYVARPPQESAPPPYPYERHGERTVLHYAPSAGQEPDWLGEIFEWLSCADEYSVTHRDSTRRIDFKHSYLGRHNLDVRVPYAAVAMHLLQHVLCRAIPGQTLEPASPVKSVRHFVVNTHDVDILPAGYFKSLFRICKNCLASLLVFRQPSAAALQIGKAFRMALGGLDPLDQMDHIMRREVERKLGATYFFLASHSHERDANYRIDDSHVQNLMTAATRLGMEIGLHGSYTSLDVSGRLMDEFRHLERQGFQPRGNRQHWLRFTLDRLIPAVERSGGAYDTSLGWDCIGFRGGACFAYPPYNFAEERAAAFLEIPLVIMDMSLLRTKRPKPEWFGLAADLLSTSRRYGWGGIALLWHPTAFGAGQLPREIEEIYWSLAENREKWGDSWVSGINFFRAVLKRYSDVGLLSREVSHDLQVANRLPEERQSGSREMIDEVAD
jgi:hypothetical protein